VLEHWAGLGYYARARNLWRAARIVVERFRGNVPQGIDDLVELPGIGRSTAGAIRALAHGKRQPILDGNVKRVLARVYAVEGWAGTPAVANALWALAERNTPAARVADYTQAIMDLGATLCTRARPACTVCPLAAQCLAAERGTQQRHPAPRPRRERPRRRVTALLVQAPDGAVLLERRPASGIWGGLFSLPELPLEHTAAEWTAATLGARVAAERALDVVAHAFTHFDLDLEPRLIRLEAAPAGICDRADLVWHVPGTRLAGGVPAPIAALLATLCETTQIAAASAPPLEEMIVG
jgi:A/G-specific adenine glycosylase